jgi:hypothetical protein
LNKSNRTLSGITQSYLLSTELKIKELFLRRKESSNQHNGIHIQRVQDLESALVIIERLLDVFDNLPLPDWVGVTVDNFTQLTHCLVVLFKLNTLNEPGWDLIETRKRADVIRILDHYTERAERAFEMAGIVENDGLNRGVLNKASQFFKTVKMLMWTEMTKNMTHLNLEKDITEGFPSSAGDTVIPDEFIMSLVQEPWLSDLMEDSWDYIYANV